MPPQVAGFWAGFCSIHCTGRWGGQLALGSQWESQVIALTCPGGSPICLDLLSHPQPITRVLLLMAASFISPPTRLSPSTPEPLFPQSQCPQPASDMGSGWALQRWCLPGMWVLATREPGEAEPLSNCHWAAWSSPRPGLESWGEPPSSHQRAPGANDPAKDCIPTDATTPSTCSVSTHGSSQLSEPCSEVPDGSCHQSPVNKTPGPAEPQRESLRNQTPPQCAGPEPKAPGEGSHRWVSLKGWAPKEPPPKTLTSQPNILSVGAGSQPPKLAPSPSLRAPAQAYLAKDVFNVTAAQLVAL